MNRSRGAFSIPLILIFCTVTVIFLVAFIQTRVNMSAQNKDSFARLKAHYLAQGGMQHALLKLRVLPNESYDAAALYRGICPFAPPTTAVGTTYQADTDPLGVFKSDVHTDRTRGGYEINPTWTDFTGWEYLTGEFKAIMAKQASTTSSERVHSVEIVVKGTVKTKLKGVPVEMTDEIKRIVKVTRNI